MCKRLKGYGEKIVKNWSAEHRPKFVCRGLLRGDDFVIQVEPVGDNRLFWQWTSRGTPRHDIPVKNAPFMVFPFNKVQPPRNYISYYPRTNPRGPMYGGPGIKHGPINKFLIVDHPGSRPRHFEEAWARWARKPFERAMLEAWDTVLERHGWWMRRGGSTQSKATWDFT